MDKKKLLEILKEKRKQNLEKIKLSRKPIIQKSGFHTISYSGTEAWYLANPDVEKFVGTEIYNEARKLYEKQEKVLQQAQKEAFDSSSEVVRLNKTWGSRFIVYDEKKSFSDNCRSEFVPFPEREPEESVYLPEWAADDIADDAIRRYNSSDECEKILKKLVKLYDKAIKKLEADG